MAQNSKIYRFIKIELFLYENLQNEKAMTMHRRMFLRDFALLGSGFTLLDHTLMAGLQSKSRYAKPYLLSEQGCGRATGYAETNKIVSKGDKIHVSWLDSTPEGFRVRVRTFDRKTNQWSPAYTVGEAYDNHGGPALAIDSQGFLHIIYYPHHHAMRYRRSANPNDASAWTEEVSFGEKLTYPTLLCGPNDVLYFTGRRSFADAFWQVELWTKAPSGGWTGGHPILTGRYPGYTHFQESLYWGNDNTIHLCCRIHEKTDQGSYGRIQTVGYLQSRDLGKTWQTFAGVPVETPVDAENIDIIEQGGLDAGKVLRAGAMAVDDRGIPHLVYSIESNNYTQSFLARPDAQGGWEKILLNQYLPKSRQDWSMLMPGGVSFNQKGQMFVVFQLAQWQEGESSWGHPSCEIGLLTARRPYERFSFELLSEENREIPNWLPSIERATGLNEIRRRPAVLFTAGTRGEGLKDVLSNEVYVVV